MMHFVGIGDSHLHAVSAAMLDLAAAHPNAVRYTPICLLDEPYRPSFTDEGGKKVPNPAMVSTLRTILDGGDEVSLFLYLGGSEYYRWSLTGGPSPFDFVDPEQDDGLPMVGEIIPYALYMAFAREKFQFLKVVADFLRTMTHLPLVQIGPPPPVRDMDSMLPRWPDVLKHVGDFGVSPRSFRVKMWNATNRAMAAECAAMDLAYLPCPPDALMPQGCLRDELVGDLMHGNKVWGQLIARRLLARANLVLEAA
jgi:hypothetical protein